MSTDIPPYAGAVERVDIAWMSVAIEDPNPIHLDEAVAKQAGFSTPIAHGTFPIGMIGAMLERWAGAGSVRALDVRLTAPTLPGDRVEATGKVAGVSDGVATVEVEARAGDRILAKGSASVELPAS